MKRIIRLTESDLTRIVRRVIMEQAPETEYGTIIIEGLEIMKTDLEGGEMEWYVAKKECEKLGEGWRLPTKEEFETILNPNKSKIPNLNEVGDYGYWSSTEYENDPYERLVFNFHVGRFGHTNKGGLHYARAVRDLMTA
jgi:hypothetical protein